MFMYVYICICIYIYILHAGLRRFARLEVAQVLHIYIYLDIYIYIYIYLNIYRSPSSRWATSFRSSGDCPGTRSLSIYIDIHIDR